MNVEVLFNLLLNTSQIRNKEFPCMHSANKISIENGPPLQSTR